MWRQPKTVWTVAFACVIAFMGIGLVDPILKPIAEELGASPSQVSLLFTSYMVVMGVAMLGTGWVSSRFGAKRTLMAGLAIIIVGAGLAGCMNGIDGIVAFRGVWGLGNALFIATALATITAAARGSVGQAIVLYEAALGVGIAAGPLLGGALGGISWRFPFFGVATLMLVALLGVGLLLPATPPSGRPSSITAPLKALRHPALLTVGLTALLYNFGFFTLLAYTPFPLDLPATQVGLVFFGWGLMLALTSVAVAPWLQRRIGTTAGILVALLGFAAILVVMGVWTGSKPVLVVCVVAAGAFLGVNNTLITETVMKAAPVERPVASAAYSFVRFTGGAIAPWLAGHLGEAVDAHLPFYVGAGAVLAGVLLLGSQRHLLHAIDREPGHGAEQPHSLQEAAVVTTADA
ncbi:MFS transporter [Arsenicicoccus sp. oral taxon 190]|uniref:MFS transporter n=1 Tax=Arsenicicoccus sp. oral taxon 190 TaxID=1658671 RepID=UPI00067A0866|nr:MFS transporter [Arsenicicoccus sp. oral taxon 190]AKT50991.1 MFS transporter [Arsenicicoccus sp. oral taxon 190]